MIVMKPEATEDEIQHVVGRVESVGAKAHMSRGEEVCVSGAYFALIAGPCTVESRDQTLDTARMVKAGGGSMFRGGAYKPRTSPYAFQGLGRAGLRILQEAKEETGLPIVTELMDARDLEAVVEVADVIQIGARNMQNYALLSEVGRAGLPVLL